MVTLTNVTLYKAMTKKFNEIEDDFDFEKWSLLASKDPEAFEQYRERVINEFITDLPEEKQQRMRCLQWRVDSVRRLSKTPMAACIEISKMMWDSIKGEHGLMDALHELQTACQFDGQYQPATRTQSNENILDFPGNRESNQPLSPRPDLL